MVIRKYIAINEEEATKLAKEDLGQDVVILNVKNNSRRGFLGIFKKPSVEITAAVDEKKEEESVPDFSKLQEAIKETNAVLAANEARVANEVKKEEKKMPDMGKDLFESFRGFLCFFFKRECKAKRKVRRKTE